jgi:hypothetical protein
VIVLVAFPANVTVVFNPGLPRLLTFPIPPLPITIVIVPDPAVNGTDNNENPPAPPPPPAQFPPAPPPPTAITFTLQSIGVA